LHTAATYLLKVKQASEILFDWHSTSAKIGGKHVFRKMSIAQKVLGSFSLLILLLLVIAAVAWWSLGVAANGFVKYRELARDANLAGRVQANMLMVRMNVKDFIIRGAQKDVEEYESYHAQVDDFMQTAQQEINDPQRASQIDQVEADLAEYHASFQQVVTHMEQRNRAVEEVLDVNGPAMEKALTKIMESAGQDEDMEAAFHAGMALRHLLLARLYVVKFLLASERA